MQICTRPARVEFVLVQQLAGGGRWDLYTVWSAENQACTLYDEKVAEKAKNTVLTDSETQFRNQSEMWSN